MIDKAKFSSWLGEISDNVAGNPVSVVTPLAEYMRDNGMRSCVQVDNDTVSTSFIAERIPLPPWACEFTRAAVRRVLEIRGHQDPVHVAVNGNDCQAILAEIA